ncbi:hypothetical protein B0H17DRAFT_1137272 [Mycena rosella]|uniref:Uncharacterized protein n=1 Tax=Mycena rosella TaxID=1033263 RepID=A0AAD7D9F1_MYCRO|nr:hypothetical protein B0H17DRAFT_1137272 [Mycena rosella]
MSWPLLVFHRPLRLTRCRPVYLVHLPFRERLYQGPPSNGGPHAEGPRKLDTRSKVQGPRSIRPSPRWIRLSDATRLIVSVTVAQVGNGEFFYGHFVWIFRDYFILFLPNVTVPALATAPSVTVIRPDGGNATDAP